jgi:pilus assembly protein CpaC
VRFIKRAVLVLIVALAEIGVKSPPVIAARTYSVTINVGEPFVIHDVDPNTVASVSHTDNSNSFIVKRTSPTDLTVFSFQKGGGTVEAKSHGEDVIYELTINGVFDSSHPLRPGVAPPAMDGADASASPVSATAGTPVAGAPAAAKVATATPVGGADSSTSSPATVAGTPVAGAPAAAEAATATDSDDSADDDDDDAAPAVSEGSTDAGVAARGGAIGSGSPSPTRHAELASASTSAASSSSDNDPSAVTPKVEEAASNSGDNYGDNYSDPAGSAASSSATIPSSRVGYTPGMVPQQSVPTLPSQQYSTDPHSPGPEGYVVNKNFGGHHELPPDEVSIASGTSQVFDFPGAISRVSIANSKVADVQILGSNQLMLVGRQPGFTTLVVWDHAGDYLERQVWTENAGHQQVLLHVIVAEVDLNKMQNQGIDLAAAFTNAGVTVASLTGSVATPFSAATGSVGPVSPPTGGEPLPLLFSELNNFIVSAHNSSVDMYGLFQLLEEYDLGKILARPELLANSGGKARFLSGGEIPIVITQQLTTTIVFKQYGTSVIFIPTVIGTHDVGLLLRSEVSQPDYTNGVELFGFKVPAFVTRRAQTQVRLKDRQTLIVAGLIQDQSQSAIRKVPYLGDVPYLGGLFRQTSWTHTKTELVMSVTPEIVNPIPFGGEVALPTARGPLTASEVATRPLATPDVTRPRLGGLYVPQ